MVTILVMEKSETDLVVQSKLDYPDLDHPDFSIIRTVSLVPILN